MVPAQHFNIHDNRAPISSVQYCALYISNSSTISVLNLASSASPISMTKPNVASFHAHLSTPRCNMRTFVAFAYPTALHSTSYATSAFATCPWSQVGPGRPKLPAPSPPPTLNATLRETIQKQTADWGTQLNIPSAEQPVKLLCQHPLLLQLPSFLTHAEIANIIDAQSSNTEEASLYLNYRVNTQVSNESHSTEAAALIAETAMANSALRADMRSGFRAQVPFDLPALQPVLDKVAHVLGFADASRRWVYNDGPWVRPNRRQILLRDVTTVHYNVAEGVAPHIDGKDITVLIGLKPARKGGRTVFVDENVAVTLRPGDALVYSSKSHMLHYAEPVEEGDKWVLQLLIDCRVRKDEMDVDYETGIVAR